MPAAKLSPLSNVMPPLTDPAWIKHANATVSGDGKTLTLNATGINQFSRAEFNVSPNTLYSLTFKGSGLVLVTGANGVTALDMWALSYSPAGTYTFNTRNNAVIRVYLSNSSAGSAGLYTWTDVTLTRAQPASPTRNLVPLFTDPAWMPQGFPWVYSDGNRTASVVATAQHTNAFFLINVTPNTVYELSVGLTNGWVAVFDGDSSAIGILPYINGAQVRRFNTGNRTRVRVYVSNYTTGAGTFTFSNLTLTKALPAFAPAKAREFFKEHVVNGGFSQGATGWIKHANALVVDGRLVLNATATGQTSAQQINGLSPGATYVLRCDPTAGIVYVYETENTVVLPPSYKQISPGATSIELKLGARTNGVYVGVSNLTLGAGTFTFDNISLRRKAP